MQTKTVRPSDRKNVHNISRVLACVISITEAMSLTCAMIL
jgi:hypothetical protein